MLYFYAIQFINPIVLDVDSVKRTPIDLFDTKITNNHRWVDALKIVLLLVLYKKRRGWFIVLFLLVKF